jgi:hypothetical protein
MLERKIKYRLITLLLLIVVTTALYVFLPDNSLSKIDKNIFRPAAIEKIDQLILTSPAQQIDLSFINGRWMLNETLQADREMVQIMFATIDQAVPKRKAAARQIDSLSRQFESKAVKVSLLRDGKVEKSYEVLGDDARKISWFKAAGSKDIYQVIIPGYSAYVAFIYQQAAHDWRDRLVFDFNWRNFVSLKLDYAEADTDDFEINMADDYFRINNLIETDTSRLNDYLDEVSLLEALKWIAAAEHDASDELAKLAADARLSIFDLAGRSRTLEIWKKPLPNNYRLARLDEKQLLWLGAKELESILRRKEEFEPKSRP